LDARLEDVAGDDVGVDDGQAMLRCQQLRHGRLARGDPASQADDWRKRRPMSTTTGNEADDGGQPTTLDLARPLEPSSPQPA